MITNYKVFEQAFSKKKFEDKATDLSIQINEHFFKLIYCHYYNKENGNIKHWKSEIIGWFSWFIKTNLKTNTKKSKLLWYNLIHGFDYEKFEYYENEWNWCIRYFNYEYQPLTEEIHDFYLKTMKELFSCVDDRDTEMFLKILDKI